MSAAAVQAVYGAIMDRTALIPRATTAGRARPRDERLGYAAQAVGPPRADPGRAIEVAGLTTLVVR